MSDLICHLLVNVKKTSKTRVLQITIRGVGSNQKNSKWNKIGKKQQKEEQDEKTQILAENFSKMWKSNKIDKYLAISKNPKTIKNIRESKTI